MMGKVCTRIVMDSITSESGKKEKWMATVNSIGTRRKSIIKVNLKTVNSMDGALNTMATHA